MNLLQLRLNPEESSLALAAEGLDEWQRKLVRTQECRAIKRAMDEEDKILTGELKQHFEETGELVETDAFKACMDGAGFDIAYDEAGLELVLGDLFQECMETPPPPKPYFSPARLEALVKLGKVDQETIDRFITKTPRAPRLVIRENKEALSARRSKK